MGKCARGFVGFLAVFALFENGCSECWVIGGAVIGIEATDTVANPSSVTVQQRIDTDWSQLRDNLLGVEFAPLSATYESHFGATKAKVTADSQ